MLSTKHTFNVFHPSDIKAGRYDKEFEFSYPVSRTAARDIVERVEGYSITPKYRKKREGAYIYKPRKKVQKIT